MRHGTATAVLNAVLAAISLISCSRPAQSPQSEKTTQPQIATPEPVPRDPAVEFRAVVSRFPKQGEYHGHYEFRDVSFDVQKTDSLMTPIVGWITFEAAYLSEPKGYTPYRLLFKWTQEGWKNYKLVHGESGSDHTDGDVWKAMKEFVNAYK